MHRVMPRVRWTSEEERRLLDLMAAGKSWTLISATLKRSMKAVKLYVRENSYGYRAISRLDAILRFRTIRLGRQYPRLRFSLRLGGTPDGSTHARCSARDGRYAGAGH